MADILFDLKELETVAALYCQGMTKKNIAAYISRDESYVQSILESAEHFEYFAYRPHLTRPLSREVEKAVYNEDLTAALNDTLKKKIEFTLNPIIITLSPPEMFETFETDPERNIEHFDRYRGSERESIKTVCERAAKEVSSNIFDGANHIVGLNYGFVVSETVNHIRLMPGDRSGNISVVSLFGDLEFHSPEHEKWPLGSMDVNCNKLVSQLAQQLGMHGEAVPLSVPGFIPARFARNTDTLKQIIEYLTSHASYRKIFGSPPSEDPARPRKGLGISDSETNALIAHMDTIITGFGSADNYTVLYDFLPAWLSQEENETLKKYCHAEKVVGDIGGHFVASVREEGEFDLDNFLKGINQRIPAAQPSDFREVASRHRKNKKGAGVVGITVGARKAKILFTLLSRSTSPCPISRLIIDTHCALALLNLADPGEFRRFVMDKGKQLIESSEHWSAGTRTLIPV